LVCFDKDFAMDYSGFFMLLLPLIYIPALVVMLPIHVFANLCLPASYVDAILVPSEFGGFLFCGLCYSFLFGRIVRYCKSERKRLRLRSWESTII